MPYTYDFRMATELYDCSRCNGTGRLPYHSNVMSGVCFKCGGTGKQRGKPVAKKAKWLVFFTNKLTGQRERVYTEGGSYSEQAVRRIVEQRYPKTGPDFKEQYDLSTMEVERERA